MQYEITPVGFVNKGDNCSEIEVLPQYEEALDGLKGYSHIIVIVWFHKRDNPQARNLLKIHPRRNKNNPLTGIFATRSPVRPNPVAVFTPEVISIEGNRITVSSMDTYDETPVIDIKPYIPGLDSIPEAVTPDFS